MPPDKFSPNDLPLREQKMLEKLAEEAQMTPIQYASWIVRRRFYGHLKDLGDDRGSFRLSENDPKTFPVDDVELR